MEREFIDLVCFPELKDVLPFARCLSEAGIEHRISEQFKDFDPTFADNRKMDQVRLQVRKIDYDAAMKAIEDVDQTPMRVIKNTARAKSSTNIWMFVSVGLLLSTLWFARKGVQREEVPAQYDPLFDFHSSEMGIEQTWKNGGKVSMRFDEDRNGIFERIEYYDRQGRLVEQWLDKDEDGVFEEWQMLDEGGQVEAVRFDRDADGRWDDLP